MILGIDGSNIRSGGTVTHLVELLRAADPPAAGFDTVIVWAGSAVLGRIENRPWLRKVAEPLLEQSADPFRDRRHLFRAYWQRFRLPKLAAAAGCDALFVPGGLATSGFRPLIAMSQNLLPFDRTEARRYGVSAARLRLVLLRIGQSRTFRRATGVIFLTRFARDRIARVAGLGPTRTAIVPHGIGAQFFASPRAQRSLAECSPQAPLRLLYVSTIDLYKHQWTVVEAVSRLRGVGLPLALDIAGPANGRAFRLLERAIARLDPAQEFVRYLGPVGYDQQPALYGRADVGVFASSCENLPIILLEAMAAGLPIACSNRGPMPEVLGEAGTYFDPESPSQIADAIRRLAESPASRSEQAHSAFRRAQQYSWAECAAGTFSFLAKCTRC